MPRIDSEALECQRRIGSPAIVSKSPPSERLENKAKTDVSES
jgi:hypothetical protein